MVCWRIIQASLLLIWITKYSKETEINEPESAISAEVVEAFRDELNEAQLQVLNQQAYVFDPLNDAPPIFQMQKDFMHAFRPHTGVGNREDLVIENLRELAIFDDGSFSKWRYFHFNNSDYLLGINQDEAILWKRSIDPSQPLELSVYDGLFRYTTEQKGKIADTVFFTRRYQFVEFMYVAILTENHRGSLISIYEISDDKAFMVSAIYPGFTTIGYPKQSLAKLVDVRSRHDRSLVVLVSHATAMNVVYEQKGSSNLNHYIEVYYPEAIDMVSFTIGGHGYVAVANSTTCIILKFNEFVRNHIIFDRLHSNEEILDLEYFRLGFNHYLLVSASNLQTLYVWKRGGLFSKQEFYSRNVVQGYGALLPNCRDDVILMLIKQQEVPDLFVWNGQKESFAFVNIGLPKNFQPKPNTITSSSSGSTAVVLFNDEEEIPKLFAIDTYLSPISDPVVLFGKEISDLMKDLQEKINEQEAVIQEIRSALVNAVRPSGNQHFTALQVFDDLKSNSVSADSQPAFIKWQGSSITIDEYKAGVGTLEVRLAQLEDILGNLESIVPDIVRTDEDAVITGQKVFIGDVIGSHVISQSLNVEFAGGLNIRNLQKDIYRLDKPTYIQGTLSFEKPLHVLNNLDVTGTVNGIDINKDVLTTNTNQESNAEMEFLKKLNILGNLALNGTLNGIDVSEEVITLDGDHVITGTKSFLGGIIAETVFANTIDGVDMHRLFTKSLTKSGEQFITETKFFTGIIQTNDIFINGSLNSHDVREFANTVIRIDQPSTIYGLTTFSEDVFIGNSFYVNGRINGLKIPDDLFFKDVSNIIAGEKTFSGVVTAHDVTVQKTVNGLNLPDEVITLSKDEVISTTLHFKNGISVGKDLIVTGLVDGIDLSELAKSVLKINETNAIENAIFTGKVAVEGDVSVNGFVNGIPLNDLVNDIVYKTDKDIIITGAKTFKNVKAETVKLNGLINGYDVQRDFMTTFGDQEITGTKIFEDTVQFHNVFTDNGLVNGINLTNLHKNRITLSIEDEVIDGGIEFIDHVIVDGDLTIGGTLGGRNFPSDFVLKSEDQAISDKEFTGTMIIDDLIVSGDAKVNGLFAGVNLEDFLNQRVTLSGDETIDGDMVFGDVSAEKVDISGNINGLDIVKFANNVMSLTKDQTVTGYKEFSGKTKIFGSIKTTDGLNGVNLTDIKLRAFKLLEDNVINTPVTFSDPVTFNQLTVGYVNNVNITQLNEDSVKTNGLQYITGDTIFHKGFHVEGDIISVNVNGLNLPNDILTKTTPQVIKETFTFKDLVVDGNLEVSGLVNGMDLSEVAPHLAKRTELESPSIIYSDVIFKYPVHVSGDVNVGGFVNGLNLTQIEQTAMLKSGNQNVSGHKVLKGNVTVYGNIDTIYVNDMHWSSFLDDVVRIDEPRVIQSRKTWVTDIEVHGDTYVSGFAEVELINDVNLNKFVEDAVFINRPAVITGTKVFSNAVEITGDLNAELINELDLKRDVVLLQCSNESQQTISGRKTFQDLKVYGDIVVDGYVNGYKLKDIVDNTLSTDGDQTIIGHKTFFKTVKFNKNVYATSVNGLKLSQDLVTLDTEQELEGDLTFTDNVHIQKNFTVAGTVNGVDLAVLAEDALYYNTDQDIEGTYIIENAIVKSEVFVEGPVNGIDLARFNDNVTEFWRTIRSEFKELREKTARHCEMIEKMHSYLMGSYYVLDGFSLHQIIEFASNSADMNVNTKDLTLVQIENPNSLVIANKYSFDSLNKTFHFMSSLREVVIKQKLYNFYGREIAIKFGIEPKNSLVYLDGVSIPEISHGFTDGDVLIQNERAVLALLYSKRSICEMFEIDARDFAVKAFGNLNVNGATSIALFGMSTVFLAMSFDSAPIYKERSKIYAYIKYDWQLMQNIPAAASSSVHHFIFHSYHYLVFTNAIPVYKTKEPMAVQVYRNTEADTMPFELFQKIPFDNTMILKTFEFGDLSELYLVVSSEVEVQVFRLEGESGFKTTFTLYGKCIKSVTPFVLENELYLIISEKDETLKTSLSTVIYKGLTQGWTISPRKFDYCL